MAKGGIQERNERGERERGEERREGGGGKKGGRGRGREEEGRETGKQEDREGDLIALIVRMDSYSSITKHGLHTSGCHNNFII